MRTLAERYHTAAAGRPHIVDDRFYIGRHWPMVIVIDQPPDGFETIEDAEATLAVRVTNWRAKFVVVSGSEIDDPMKARAQ